MLLKAVEVASKVSVVDSERVMALAAAMDTVRELSGAQLLEMRVSELVEKLEAILEKKEKKRLKSQQLGLGGGGNGGVSQGVGAAGVPAGFQGVMAGPGALFGVASGGVGGPAFGGAFMGHPGPVMGMQALGMQGMGSSSVAGGSGLLGKRGPGMGSPACYLCGQTTHKVEACALNVARWGYQVIQRLQKEGLTAAQIVARMQGQPGGQMGQQMALPGPPGLGH